MSSLRLYTSFIQEVALAIMEIGLQRPFAFDVMGINGPDKRFGLSVVLAEILWLLLL
jgi:hypothetical protein